ncbi:hypothetical protein BH23VER1_BH23VER1_17030 [soil metagenome]
MTTPPPDDPANGDADDRFGDFDKTAPKAQPEFRSTDEPGLHTTYVRRKRVTKARKEVDTTPEWETPEPKLKAASAGARHGQSELVSDGDDEHPEGMEKRRRQTERKRRIPTKAERIFLSSPKVLAVILVLVIGVVAVIGTIGAFNIARKAPDAAIKAAERSAEEAESALDPEIAALLPNYSTREDERTAEAAIEMFLEADGIEEKLEHVRRPEAVLPLMKKWYARSGNADHQRPRSMAEVLLRRKLVIGSKEIFTVAAQVAPQLNIQFFAVEKISPGNFKVDWEVSAGYQDMPIEEFKELRPTTPTRFRVQVSRSDYFNHAFSDPGTHDAYLLKYPGRPDFELYAYAERNMPAAAALFVEVVPGTSNPMILDLRFPKNPETNNQVIIDNLVRTDWFLD